MGPNQHGILIEKCDVESWPLVALYGKTIASSDRLDIAGIFINSLDLKLINKHKNKPEHNEFDNMKIFKVNRTGLWSLGNRRL